MVWSSKLKVKISVLSNKWLLRYSIINILRSSPIGGHLHLGICKIWFSHLSLSCKFEFNPISGCWDIPLILFWGHLPLEVIFIWRICKIWVCHLSLSLTFEFNPISGLWDIPLSIFWGRLLLLEVFFISRIYKMWFGHLSLGLKF